MLLSNTSLAYRLPDLPRWVEVRDLLLWGDCEILGLRQEPDLSFVLRDPETVSVFVVARRRWISSNEPFNQPWRALK